MATFLTEEDVAAIRAKCAPWNQSGKRRYQSQSLREALQVKHRVYARKLRLIRRRRQLIREGHSSFTQEEIQAYGPQVRLTCFRFHEYALLYGDPD